MPHASARALCLAIAVLLPAAGCSWLRPSPSEAQQLQQRLAVSLQPQLTDGQASLEPVPNGVRVTLLTAPLFPAGSAELGDTGKLTLAGVIQGLFSLDRTQLVVDGCPSEPAGGYACQLPAARASSIIQYFEQNGFNAGMVSAAGSAPLAPTTVQPPLAGPRVVLTLHPVAA